MPGRHRAAPEWTVQTLREHLLALLAELDRRMEQRFAAMDRALDLAQVELTRWQAAANEWRGAMNDRDRNQMPRLEIEQRLTALADRLTDLATRLDRAEGRTRGRGDGWGYFVGGVGLLVGVAGVILALVGP